MEAAAALDTQQQDTGVLMLMGAQRALDAYAGTLRAQAPSEAWLLAPLVARRSGGRQRRRMRIARHGPLHVVADGQFHRPSFVGGLQAQQAFLEAAAAYGIDVGAEGCQTPA